MFVDKSGSFKQIVQFWGVIACICAAVILLWGVLTYERLATFFVRQPFTRQSTQGLRAQKLSASTYIHQLYRRYGKRALDILLALLALFLSAPVMAIVAVIIRFNLGSPVLFKQVRPGLDGKPFMMLKFRTMKDTRDVQGHLLPDEQRLTKFGRMLRSTSLDELPELFNVLMGDMSLVGPRPLLMRYLPLYTPQQARRHQVRPGITGWAQINGRNALTWEKKFELDVWYVENCSPWTDMHILFKTVWKVVNRDGISMDGFATMPEFKGVAAVSHDHPGSHAA